MAIDPISKKSSLFRFPVMKAWLGVAEWFGIDSEFVPKEFLGRLSGTRPVAIVVQDEQPARLEPVVQDLQLDFGAFVPIRVESKDGNLFRNLLGLVAQRVLHLALDEMHLVLGVPREVQVVLDHIERAVVPFAFFDVLGSVESFYHGCCGVFLFLRLDLSKESLGAFAVPCVGGFRESLKGVEQPEMAVGVVSLVDNQHTHRDTTLPHPAFHHVTLDPQLVHPLDRSKSQVQMRGFHHGEQLDHGKQFFVRKTRECISNDGIS